MKEGAIELDDVVVKDPTFEIDVSTPQTHILRAGKKQLPHKIVIGQSSELEQVRVKKLGDKFIAISRERAGVAKESGPHEISLLGKERWSKFLALAGQAPSTAEAEELIKQNEVRINGQVLSDPTARLDFNEKAEYVARIGKKKFVRIVVE